MAISTSPYQPNDYQAASTYRPYRLPINEIAGAVAAQNQFWDEGARRVKAYYDNALGLDLTLDENKELRRNFMQEAETQIAKLSTMNLADPTVQRKGMGIFKPLFQDKALLYDDQITKKYGSILSEAERYKRDEKTKGEGYHRDNLLYALQGFEGFGAKSRREDLQGIYDKVKNAEYIPYHDVSKEYMDIASKCKADKMSTNSVQGLYFHEQTDNSLDASQLNGCIKGGLSDKAWQQLRITGSVRYGKNYGALAEGYAPILQGNNQSHANTLLQLAAEKKKLRDSGKLTPELEQAYTQQEGNLRAKITRNDVALNRLSTGDYTDIEKDYDNVVSQVWGNQDIGGFAQAFAYKDITEKWSANAAAIAQYREQGENARFGARLNFDMKKFGVESQLKQAELQMKAEENKINLLKGLLGGGGSGKGGGGLFSMSGGLTYETFNHFVKPILQSLGIDDPDNISSFLDNGTVVKNVGETYDSIQEKANEFHHQRMEAADGMGNVLQELGVSVTLGKESAEDIYKKADQFLARYDQTEGDNPELAGKTTEVSKLRQLTNDYTRARSQVWSFMKMRDQVQERINKNPSLQSALKASDTELDNYLSKNANRTVLVVGDPVSKQAIPIYPDRLKTIVKGGDPEFQLRDGKIVNKAGVAVSDVTVDRDSYHRVESEIKQKGLLSGNYKNWELLDRTSWVGLGNKILGDLQGLLDTRKKTVYEPATGILKDVVRNTTIYGVGNVPGLGNTIKQQFSAISPEFGNGEYQYKFVPGISYEGVTQVDVFRKREKGSDKDDEDNSEQGWEAVDPQSVIKTIAKNKYAVGGVNNIAIDGNGKLTVKTPYLPMYQQRYELEQVVGNEFYGAKNAPALGNQEKRSVEIRRLNGGVRTGFDVVGQGSGQPSTYRVWYTLPNGTKEYLGPDLYSENQISAGLLELESMMPRLLAAQKRSKK